MFGWWFSFVTHGLRLGAPCIMSCNKAAQYDVPERSFWTYLEEGTFSRRQGKQSKARQARHRSVHDSREAEREPDGLLFGRRQKGQTSDKPLHHRTSLQLNHHKCEAVYVCSSRRTAVLVPLSTHLLWSSFCSTFFISRTCTFQLLDRPWSQVSSLLPPGSCLQFLSRVGFSNPTARRFFIECC